MGLGVWEAPNMLRLELNDGHIASETSCGCSPQGDAHLRAVPPNTIGPSPVFPRRPTHTPDHSPNRSGAGGQTIGGSLCDTYSAPSGE